jgi:hypothetical protein
MAELLDNEDGGVHGAVNELDTVLSRGEGLFDIDFSKEDVREGWKERKICEEHRKELSTNWDSSHYYHYYRRRSSPARSGQNRLCSIPKSIEEHNPRPNLKTKLEINKDEAFAMLKKEGLLLHIGLRK